jgi:hypothetical protein
MPGFLMVSQYDAEMRETEGVGLDVGPGEHEMQAHGET